MEERTIVIRIGIVGFGNIGQQYFNQIQSSNIKNAQVTAISVFSEKSIKKAKDKISDKIRVFNKAEDLCKSNFVDAVIIATPNQTHVSLAKVAMDYGKHVLVEKPLGIWVDEITPLIEHSKGNNLVFSVQYQERVNPIFIKCKQLLETNTIGDIQRIHWQVMQYYRSDSYYSGRGTWKKDGGGVLLNQAIHQLDLWQYLFKMPEKLLAHCRFGGNRNIEVEDEVISIMEYSNGVCGTFVTSVNENITDDRLEIIGENGMLIVENQKKNSIKNIRKGNSNSY